MHDRIGQLLEVGDRVAWVKRSGGTAARLDLATVLRMGTDYSGDWMVLHTDGVNRESTKVDKRSTCRMVKVSGLE